MTHTNITAFRKNAFGYVNQAVTYGEVVHVSTKNGNAVILSEDDYRSMMETLYLNSIPGMVESIQQAAREPIEECTPYNPEEDWGRKRPGQKNFAAARKKSLQMRAEYGKIKKH